MEQEINKGGLMAPSHDPPLRTSEQQFPLDIFPKHFQSAIEKDKNLKGIDINYSALSYLSLVSSYLKADVRVYGNEGQWNQPTLLFCAMLGRLSDGKTKALDKFEATICKKNDEHLEYCKTNELDQTPFYAEQFTTQGLVKYSVNNEQGILCEIDEIAGWIKDMNKVQAGGDKEFWLKAWNGKGISKLLVKEILTTKKSCLNLIGGIQPSKLRFLMNEESNLDGFLCRFLIVKKADDSPEKLPSKKERNLYRYLESNEHNLNSLLENIWKLTADNYTLDDEADEIFINWYNAGCVKNHSNDFQLDYFKKLSQYSFRIAGILHVMKHCSLNKTPPLKIGADTMNDAIKVVLFFKSQMTQIMEIESVRLMLINETKEFQKKYFELNKYKHYGSTFLAETHFKDSGRKSRQLKTIIKHSGYFIQDEKTKKYRRKI